MADQFSMNYYGGDAVGGSVDDGPVTDAKKEIIPEGPEQSRKFVHVDNLSPTDGMFIAFGGAAKDLVWGKGIYVGPGEWYTFNLIDITYDAIWAVTDAGKSVAYSWHTGK